MKVFLVADEAERARRRGTERPGEEAELLAADLRRGTSETQSTRRPAADAVLLDTTDLNVAEVVARIAELVEARVR